MDMGEGMLISAICREFNKISHRLNCEIHGPSIHLTSTQGGDMEKNLRMCLANF